MRAQTPATSQLRHAAAAVLRDRAPSAVDRRVAPTKRRRKESAAGDRFLLLPSFHSEPTREVLMQSGPGTNADRMTVAYHAADVEFDLTVRGTALLAGKLECGLVLDGASQDLRGDWQSVCWYADDDGDYL